MAWIFFINTGLLENDWPVGLKMAQVAASPWAGVALAVNLHRAERAHAVDRAARDPMRTTHAVWTGIGAAGAFLVGVLVYGNPTSLARFADVALIAGRVAALKLEH